MFEPTRRQLLIAAAAAAALPSYANDQPIRISVGFPPGGTTDVIARLIAQNLGQKLGRSVIVENRAGASHGHADHLRAVGQGEVIVQNRSERVTHETGEGEPRQDTTRTVTQFGSQEQQSKVTNQGQKYPRRGQVQHSGQCRGGGAEQ